MDSGRAHQHYYGGNRKTIMARQKISGIYKITNIINGKCYIGQSIDIKNRWRGHRNSFFRNDNKNSTYLKNAFNKHGIDNFKFEVLEEIDISNIAVPLFAQSLLTNREQYWVDYYKSCNRNFGYNVRVVVNSNIGIKRNEEQIEAMRKLRTGKKLPKSTIDKLLEIRKNWTWSEESKQKISKTLMGHEVSEETIKKGIESKKKMDNLSEEDFEFIKNHQGSSTELTKKYGVSNTIISNIKRGLRKGKGNRKKDYVVSIESKEKNSKSHATLTEEQIRYIRKSNENQSFLAKQFQCSQSNISLIRLGKSYKWVKDDNERLG